MRLQAVVNGLIDLPPGEVKILMALCGELKLELMMSLSFVSFEETPLVQLGKRSTGDNPRHENTMNRTARDNVRTPPYSCGYLYHQNALRALCSGTPAKVLALCKRRREFLSTRTENQVSPRSRQYRPREQKFKSDSTTWFRSRDLWVMSPALYP
ncbi:uncharacterized protein CLUP02_09499 [Colletotrichum lupini]|uniref:Uncharacterized protein n=1 Tax=Colletotrichum lupini TaxID=145971 RepID=A0A9Q8SVK4_9PEZI|nr:uncharacterized protein CLUP02_09499 [Colletotrichum lupini]UQC84003.1 hypothetical protein CLUP02_09499 [Colletotrichum lupini]